MLPILTFCFLAFWQTALFGQVVINEIHYNPSPDQGSDDDYEFLELYNTADVEVDLSGWYFTEGVEYTFPQGILIPESGYLVLAKNALPVEEWYGITGVLQWSDGGLSNGGEDIILVNAQGETVDSLVYDDAGEWPSEPDGNGPSLELISPLFDNALPASWAPSEVDNGTPGVQNSVTTGENAPIITYITLDPAMPGEWDPVQVSAVITSDEPIITAWMRWGLSPDTLNTTVAMLSDSNEVWRTVQPVPPFPGCTRVYFRVGALDEGGQVSESPLQDYQVFCLLPIAAIQGDGEVSPYVGQEVNTSGRVTWIYSSGVSTWVFLQDSAAARCGITVYAGDTTLALSPGDEVVVSGTATEFYGLTEIILPSWTFLAGGAPFPPVVLTAAQAAEEDWESVLVRVVEGVCTNPDLGFGEWELSDSSGTVRIDDWFTAFTPEQDACYSVQGILNFSYENYKIEPLTEGDIEPCSQWVEPSVKSLFRIYPAYPNPFNPETVIPFSLSHPARVRMTVFDLLGRPVCTLLDDDLASGRWEIPFHAEEMAAGTYFFQLEVDSRQEVGRLILLP